MASQPEIPVIPKNTLEDLFFEDVYGRIDEKLSVFVKNPLRQD
jgi:hypothetical protein